MCLASFLSVFGDTTAIVCEREKDLVALVDKGDEEAADRSLKYHRDEEHCDCKPLFIDSAERAKELLGDLA